MQAEFNSIVRQTSIYATVFVAGILFNALWQISTITLPRVDFGQILPDLREVDLLPAIDPQTALWAALSLVGIAGFIALSRVAIVSLTRAPRNTGAEAVAPRAPNPEDTKSAHIQAVETKAVGSRLEAELAEILKYVNRYLESSAAEASTMERLQTTLATADTLEQVRASIKLLIASGAQARHDAKELRSRLAESQAQTARLHERLVRAQELATSDSLTSVSNRRRFEEFLASEIASSHRDRSPLCLVMSDIDHFKMINDRLGHQAGDSVLRQFAKLLSKSIRGADLVARYGGEEFALVLPRTPVGNASFLAERIRKEMAATIWKGAADGQTVGPVTASFGVSEIRENDTPDTIIKRADQMLYDAKRKGRNRVEIDSCPGS